MPVVASDLGFFESIDADSLGGAITTLQVPVGLNLFYDDVDLAEALTGSTAYRCFYVHNTNLVDTLTAAEIYISVRTPNPSTSCELGLGTSGLNGIEQSIVSENIAPVGVVFLPTSDGSPLVIGNLGPDEFYPIWIKRIVNSDAQGYASDSVIVQIRGEE
jgi:hypothetical protein